MSLTKEIKAVVRQVKQERANAIAEWFASGKPLSEHPATKPVCSANKFELALGFIQPPKKVTWEEKPVLATWRSSKPPVVANPMPYEGKRRVIAELTAKLPDDYKSAKEVLKTLNPSAYAELRKVEAIKLPSDKKQVKLCNTSFGSNYKKFALYEARTLSNNRWIIRVIRDKFFKSQFPGETYFFRDELKRVRNLYVEDKEKPRHYGFLHSTLPRVERVSAYAEKFAQRRKTDRRASRLERRKSTADVQKFRDALLNLGMGHEDLFLRVPQESLNKAFSAFFDVAKSKKYQGEWTKSLLADCLVTVEKRLRARGIRVEDVPLMTA